MSTKSFYKSKRWERLRRSVLARDGYRCQLAARFGRNTPATTVHHIFPRDRFPELQWQSWNLISLSTAAHDRMHDRTTNQLTEEGQELMRRTARKKGIDYHGNDQRNKEEGDGKDHSQEDRTKDHGKEDRGKEDGSKEDNEG